MLSFLRSSRLRIPNHERRGKYISFVCGGGHLNPKPESGDGRPVSAVLLSLSAKAEIKGFDPSENLCVDYLLSCAHLSNGANIAH
jgi:hypothetical protein